MIAGLHVPDSGKVYVEEEDVTGFAAHKLFLRGVSRTFQLAHEFSGMTVWENLLVSAPFQPGERLWNNWLQRSKVMGRESEIREEALEVLDFLKLSPLRDEMAGRLSGGQKKLLELGRVMMGRPHVVLLDEIAAGINPLLMKEIGDMIVKLNEEKGYSFCVIEHDMEIVERLCDHVIVLVRGRVLKEGSIEEVRSDAGVQESYLGG
jgi:branched-chain amino acid transport system ATP-binding protein